MSIVRRLLNLGRTELNSLLDRASQLDDGEEDDDSGRDGWSKLETMSDEELEAELQRRKRERENEAEEAARPRARASSSRSSGTRSTGGTRSGGTDQPTAKQVARAYAMIEVPPTADFETVRKSYRNLMRKYHPDRHTETPEKQKAANEVAQKLTAAYKLLEKRLRR